MLDNALMWGVSAIDLCLWYLLLIVPQGILIKLLIDAAYPYEILAINMSGRVP